MHKNTKLNKKLLGENIKLFRNHKRYTQAEFAEMIDVSIGSISQMERGDYAPRLSTFYLICDVLSVDPKDLLYSRISQEEEVCECNKQYAKDLIDNLNSKQIDTIISIMTDFKK